jgi:serine/threonine protein phosphatase 1
VSEDDAPIGRIGFLDINRKGRDFAVGDIHGMWSVFERALKLVDFNPKSDRVICVGDLVDRGEASARMVEFCRYPWFHSVQGNHDEAVAAMIDRDGSLIEAVYKNSVQLGHGTEWLADTPPDIRLQIKAIIRDMPLSLNLLTRRGDVGFVHADIPEGMSWQDFQSRLMLEDEETIQRALRGRRRFREMFDIGVSGVGRVFVGHSPRYGGAQKRGNVFNIDTGCVYGYRSGTPDSCLTLVRIAGADEDILRPANGEPINICNPATVPTTKFRAWRPQALPR